MGIQEVVNQHIVATLLLDGLILEQFLVGRRANTHVLLGKRADMSIDVMGVL